jgi:phosphoribosylformylglycinamidine cyclo-ligase
MRKPKKAVAGQATYAGAGVDIDAGEEFVALVRQLIAEAWPEMAEQIGGFAGGAVIPEGIEKIGSGCDGAGTKPLLSVLAGQLSGSGQDAAAMSLVDAYVGGFRPAFLLDTVKTGKLVPNVHIEIVKGVIAACKMAGAVLLGGETAEMPGLYRYPWYFDVDTTTIGFADPALAYAEVQPGQDIFGWPSGGLGANGLSLARKILRLTEGPAKTKKRLQRRWPELGGQTLAEALLVPTPIWIQQAEAQRQQGVKFAGHAHITGGGLTNNLPRILPPHLTARIFCDSWVRPPIFGLLQRLGNVAQPEMSRTFNNGVMMASIVVTPGPSDPTFSDQNALRIGQVVRRDGTEPQVEFVGQYRDPA